VSVRTRDYYGYLVWMDVLWRLNAFVCSQASSCWCRISHRWWAVKSGSETCSDESKFHHVPWGTESSSSTLSYLGAWWGWVVNATPQPPCPREWWGTYSVGGWVAPRAGVNGFGQFAPAGIWFPDRPPSP